MRILLLGGSSFLGRHLIEEGLRRGHALTLFNRGQTNPGLYGEVEELRGERGGDLAALQGRRWDRVLDTSGYLPGDVRRSAGLLTDATEHYTFISSISAYADASTPGQDESAPLAELPDDASEDVLAGEHYGALKVRCERAVQAAFGDRALIVRPGLIVGPHDGTNRFGYWVHRVGEGGDVLAPAPPEQKVQFIDARDLAAFVLDRSEACAGGVYNATGRAPLTLGELLDAIRDESASDARLVWVDERFLLEHEVEPWTELPLWLPAADGEYAGFNDHDVTRAVAAGLRSRPLAETIRDTLAWERARGGPQPYAGRLGNLGGSLTAERERELLEAWRARA
jgi:2'-hydroxyisoflavone reductase